MAFAYIGVNAIGFAANFWVLYTVAPLLFSGTVKVPKSILFYIITLCISDLMIMTGMFPYQRSEFSHSMIVNPMNAY